MRRPPLPFQVSCPRPLPRTRRGCESRGWTLIEVLVVLGIMGIMLLVAIPTIHRQLHPESMQKAVRDLMEACSHARAHAILHGQEVDLVIRGEDGLITLQPAGRTGNGGENIGAVEAALPAAPSTVGGGFSARLSDKVAIELLEVNFQDQMEFEEARVRFYPNGTSDEFKMLLFRPETGERRLITLEVVTALADVESDLYKMTRR